MTGEQSKYTRTENIEINPLVYWRVLVKRKKTIGMIVAAAFFASVIISLILPPKYDASTSLLPPQQEGGIGANLMSQLPGGLGSFAGGFLNASSPADTWIAILNSQTIRDTIINRFDLMKVLKAKTMEDARLKLKSMTKILKSKDGIVSITVEDKDPVRATALANGFVEELDRMNKSIVMSSGRRTRIFIEKRLNDAEEELTKSENNMRAFQEKNKAVKLDDQSKVIIEALGSIKGQLIAKELELKTLLSYATPDNPYADILIRHIEDLKGQLKELEEGKMSHANPSAKDIFIPTSTLPGLSIQFARLYRDVKIQQTLYEILTQQYEMARIQEAKDTPTVQVLDIAKVPETRSKPRRGQIVLLSTVTSLFFGAFLSLSLEYIDRLKKDEV